MLAAQELLAEGLADGRRLNPKQYMAMKTRDRAVKKAGLTVVPLFLYEFLPSTSVVGS